ncbi:isochorismate synthase [Kineococcus endophyticus]|uniref:isochorismate synthase n=1 Tax=Kineococcus endophyticus TaxID=1181883 RepID=A0ABV3PCP9_9ACTN
MSAGLATTAAAPRPAVGTDVRWEDASFAVAAPSGLVHATGGTPLDVPRGHEADVVAAVREAFRRNGSRPGDGSLVCGVVPFDPDGTAELSLVRDIVRRPWAPPAAGAGRTTREVPDDPGYRAAVAEALLRIGAGDLEKVVLARTLDTPLPVGSTVGAYLDRLAAANPHGWTFAVRTAAGLLTGASPELVAAVDGNGLVSHPLAGSRPRRAGETGPPADLLSSTKDHREHALVVDHIAERLAPLTHGLDVPAAPVPTATDTMWHLGTRITGTPRAGVGSLDAALRIHPTPAVSGVPVEAALDLVRTLEPAPRGNYAGLVGWTDAAGHGEWALVLRCALLDTGSGSARLWAGAGVVAGSTPDAEHAETAAKFATALAALTGDDRPTEGPAQ